MSMHEMLKKKSPYQHARLLQSSSVAGRRVGKADTAAITILSALHATKVKSATGAKSAQAIRDF